MIYSSLPFLVGFLAYVFLKEPLKIDYFIGLVLVILGLYIALKGLPFKGQV